MNDENVKNNKNELKSKKRKSVRKKKAESLPDEDRYMESIKPTYAKRKSKVLLQYLDEDEGRVTVYKDGKKTLTVVCKNEPSREAIKYFNEQMQEYFCKDVLSKIPQIDDLEIINELYDWYWYKFWNMEIDEVKENELWNKLNSYYQKKYEESKEVRS